MYTPKLFRRKAKPTDTNIQLTTQSLQTAQVTNTANSGRFASSERCSSEYTSQQELEHHIPSIGIPRLAPSKDLARLMGVVAQLRDGREHFDFPAAFFASFFGPVDQVYDIDVSLFQNLFTTSVPLSHGSNLHCRNSSLQKRGALNVRLYTEKSDLEDPHTPQRDKPSSTP